MVLRVLRLALIASLTVLILAFAASAQGGEGQSGAATGPRIVLQVPDNGVGYTDNGELLLVAHLTNVGDEISPPLNVTALLLNDCIVPSVLQTCRFAAFGVFDKVTPNGIPADTTVQWTFNFGPHPDLDLSRWTVIWYHTPAN